MARGCRVAAVSMFAIDAEPVRCELHPACWRRGMAYERILVSRDELYARVWAQPVSAVAKSYGISDVGLAKICRRLGVPIPPLGYWAKKQHGKPVKQPPLPPPPPDTATETTIHAR